MSTTSMHERRAPLPGDVLAGKYRVESVLGQGGMGVVLGVRHVTLDEPLALKVLRPEAMMDGEAVARFLREARAAVRIKGEHVARVLDVGSLDNGMPYMAMERLEGIDLSALVEQHGWLPCQTAVDYVLQACEALAEAHALGIVHRDVKPSNLFLTTKVDGTPCVKVLDFGISKATNPVDATRPDFGMTQTQTVMGSPQYMAPEQMRSSRRVDGRTDIWAIGTIMHELLTGQPPFSARTMPELFAMILQDPAPSLRSKRPDVPEGLDAVVARCLQKQPEARPENIHELAVLLAPFGTPLSQGAPERIARLTRHLAFGSSPRLPPVPTPDQSGPSAPALAHAHTTEVGVPREVAARTRLQPSVRTGIVVGVAFAALLVTGVLLGASALRARSRSATSEPAVVTSAVVASGTSELPPAPTDSAPTATSALSPTAPATATSTSPATEGSQHKVPDVRPVGAARPPASALPSATARVSAAASTPPPKPPVAPPAGIASSRYD